MLGFNSCEICNDSISDPVCRRCYLNEINLLLNDLKIRSLDKKIILNKIKTGFPIETSNDIECILCKEDNVAICRYCFSIILTNVLKKFNFNEEVIENFGYNYLYEENYIK